MKLQVLHPVEDAGLVQVEGAGVSGWCVWPDAPAPGVVVDVELSVPGEVSWDDVEVGAAGARGLAPATGLVVEAVVLDVDEQDVATLRLPDGGIVLVDAVGKPPPGVVGRDVTLRLDRVLVHPTAV